MAVLGARRGPIGLVAALRFKILDSQPDSSNMGTVWIDVHVFHDFRKGPMASWHGIYRVFSPGASKFAYVRFSVGIKKMRGEKLCRFVVVSPREVPYSIFSCPSKISNVRSFLKALSFACLISGSLVFTKFGHQPLLSMHLVKQGVPDPVWLIFTSRLRTVHC